MDRKEFRKSTKVELMRRINRCVDVIMKKHLNYTMFCDWFMEEFEMSKHNADKYWYKVWKIIKSQFALETEQLVSKQIYELYDIYAAARDTGDLGTARKILEDIRKIQGIEAPDKLNIKHEGTIRVSFCDEE